MMYKRKDRHSELCVLRVSSEVVHSTGVIICDGNAASAATNFFENLESAHLDTSVIFGESWTNTTIENLSENRRKRCAEVLVPDSISPSLVIGAYVSSIESRNRLAQWMPKDMIQVLGYMFFR